MRFRECSLLILSLLTVSFPAKASQWYPIDTGRYWVYSGPGGGSYSAVVGAPESFAGSIVQPLQWSGGVRDNLSQDGAGRVFHHGMTYPDGSYVVFDPPMLFMDSDLTPGHQWEAIHEVIHYSAGGVEVGREQGRETSLVINVGPVDVPAGTFLAVEVLRTREWSSLPIYTFRDMYAEGVGWVRRTEEDGTSVIFALESYGGGPLRTEASTWGAVKSLYRD